MLPKPSASFTIPSLHDDLELNCRLYFSHYKQDDRYNQIHRASGCAVFAHPYAPLGGCYDDPIVHSVGSLLLSEGYVLATFNFRGAEASPGKTSWTGKGELGDYVSVVAFVLCFLDTAGMAQYMLPGRSGRRSLVLGGYSYGSMIASHLPSVDVIHAVIAARVEGSAEYEIWQRANDLSKAFFGYCEAQQYRGRSHNRHASDQSRSPVSIGGYDSPDGLHGAGKESPRRSLDVERFKHSMEKVRNKFGYGHDSNQEKMPGHARLLSNANWLAPNVAILLVSPILGTVSGLTTLFTKLSFEPHGSHMSAVKQDSNFNILVSSPALILYGSRDRFTSSRKLRAWCDGLKSKSQARFEYCEISKAGHFWIEPGAQDELTMAISHWLRDSAASPMQDHISNLELTKQRDNSQPAAETSPTAAELPRSKDKT